MSIQWQHRSKGICFLVKNDHQDVLATSSFFRNEMWARIGFMNACDLCGAPIAFCDEMQKEDCEIKTTECINILQKKQKLYYFQYISCSGKTLLTSTYFASLDDAREAIQQVNIELTAYRSILRKTRIHILEGTKKKQSKKE